MAYDATIGMGIDEGPNALDQEALRKQAALVSQQAALAAPSGAAAPSAPTAQPSPFPPGSDPWGREPGHPYYGRPNEGDPIGAVARGEVAAPAPAGGAAGGATPAAANPNAPPTGPTSNAGTQAAVRNTYMGLATQNPTVDPNDPAIKGPTDVYRANIERSVRSAASDAAEANGPYATGKTLGDTRMLRERGGALSGQFAADLVTRENTARRSEILQALQGLQGTITEDQRQALERELAQLNASLQTQSLNQNQSQFADTLGLNVANADAYWNDQALRTILTGQ